MKIGLRRSHYSNEKGSMSSRKPDWKRGGALLSPEFFLVLTTCIPLRYAGNGHVVWNENEINNNISSKLKNMCQYDRF